MEVWKFTAEVAEEVVVMMPRGARVLTVQMQHPAMDPKIWAVVDTEAPVEARRFVWAGTGHRMPPVGTYIGTVQYMGLVFHLFEAEQQSETADDR